MSEAYMYATMRFCGVSLRALAVSACVPARHVQQYCFWQAKIESQELQRAKNELEAALELRVREDKRADQVCTWA